MNLETTIERALQLTRDITLLLAGDDLGDLEGLLSTRAEAMAAFEVEHRKAGLKEREATEGLLERLALADKELQDTLQAMLEDTRRLLHSSAAIPVSAGSYDSRPVQACVDRKA